MLQYHFNWKTLSAMAGVTWWNFYFRLFPGTIRSPQVVEFLEHLLRHLPGKLLIWDGLRSHRSRLVWDFVRQQHGRLWLEFLPAMLRNRTEPSRAPGTVSHAQTADSGDRLLGSRQTCSVVTILCNVQ